MTTAERKIPANLWWQYLLAVAVAVPGYFHVPTFFLNGDAALIARHTWYIAFGWVSVGILAWVILRVKPRCPEFWWTLVAAIALNRTGSAIHGYSVLIWEWEYPPGPGDFLFALVHPTLLVAVILLARARKVLSLGLGLDAAIIGLGITAVWWVYFVAPISRFSLPWPLFLSITSFFVGTLLVIGALIAVLIGGARLTPAFAMLMGGISMTMVGNILSGLRLFNGIDLVFGLESEYVALVFYMVNYPLMAAAAMHPSMQRLTQPVEHRFSSLTLTRVGMLTVAVLFAPVVLLGQQLWGELQFVVLLLLGTMGLFVLVMSRMYVLTLVLVESLRREKKVAEAVAVAATSSAERRGQELARQLDDLTRLVSKPARRDLD